MFNSKQVFKDSTHISDGYKNNYVSKFSSRYDAGIKLSRICSNCGFVFGMHEHPSNYCPIDDPIFINSSLLYFDYGYFKHYQYLSSKRI